MGQTPTKKREEQLHVGNQGGRLKLLKDVLHECTPLATVLQEVVVEFMREATTLFVSDWGKSVVLAVDLENNNAVRVLAGKSCVGGRKDGRGSKARFACPDALAVDPASGALVVSDLHSLRRIAHDCTVSTLCGNAYKRGYCEGVGSAAFFNSTNGGCTVMGKDVFVTDTNNHCVRRVPLDGSSTSLFAGSPGQPGCVNGVGTEAKFNEPMGLCQDRERSLIFADHNNHVIRKVTPAGVATTLAGSGETGSRDGPAKEASFSFPQSVAYDAERHRVLVIESNKHSIRSIDLCTDQVSTIRLERIPSSTAVDCTGDIFVGTTCGAIHRVSPDGQVEVILSADEFSQFRIAPLL